ncbi:hypothetical protein EB1_17130 [Empedobacter brevis NBRC 14943 = ATCC 43319]|uniref:Uncharacterized protein n=2 Tax=Empedobacter brevis TaxID=247 RepID=A0A511NGI6_9FLAO|nr:hypothetical protein EB1_17130 [Empedobacter brevis NBRC 14943 = ATCC 43319]
MISWDKKIVRNNSLIYLLIFGFVTFISFLLTLNFEPENPKNTKQIELLKNYTPDFLHREIPLSFYTNRGFRDWYRYPLPYPYSINWVDTPNYGAEIIDERNIDDINFNEEGKIKINIKPIRLFSFNQKYLVAGVSSDDNYKKDSLTYIIFHFGSNKIEQFKNKIDLTKRTDELKFDRVDSMVSLEDYENKFH